MKTGNLVFLDIAQEFQRLKALHQDQGYPVTDAVLNIDQPPECDKGRAESLMSLSLRSTKCSIALGEPSRWR